MARGAHALPRLLARALSIASLLVVAAPATGARAQTAPAEADLERAREQFAEARRLEDRGEWAGALELLQRVAEVKTTPQVRFHLALCKENVGLLTEALEGFARAEREASAPPGAPDVVKESQEHIKALEQRIPTVAIRVHGAERGDDLLLDRRSIPLGDPPLALRADPGAHTAEVRRGDRIVARETFVLESKGTRQVELRVGQIGPEPAEPGPAPPPAPPPSAPPPPAAPPPPPPSDGSTQRTLGWATLGVGAASAIATGIFIGLRAGALSRLDEQCFEHVYCDPAVESTVSEGQTYSALVNVFGIAAGAGVLGGIALLVTAPSAPAAAAPAAGGGARGSAPGASIFVGPGGGGLVIRGAL